MFSGTSRTLVQAIVLAGLTAGVSLAQALTITTPSQLLPAMVGVPYSQTFAATGGTPPYTWSFLGSLPLGLVLNGATLSGTPGTNAQSSFIIRVMDAAGNVATQQENLQIGTGGSLLRSGVLAQVAAGSGWDTTIYLVSTSTVINGVKVQFKDDTGNPLTLAVTTQQQGIVQSVSGTTFTFILNPATTVVLHTAASANAPLQTGWADVSTTGGIGAYAIFKQTLPNGVVAVGTSPLQTQFGSSIVMPFDNTAGNTTTMALVSVSNMPLTVTATEWDENGVQLGTQTLNLVIGAHMAFAIPTQFPATAGKRGEVRFDNNTNSDGLGALGLSFTSATGNSFTSVPPIVP